MKMGKTRVENNITITFFGTRGSTPVSGADYMKYGGNTACIAFETDGRLMILDCGTGMHSLQQEYFQKKGYKEADIFISHIHWDHVQGIPFFAPFFNKECRFDIYGEERKKMSIGEQIEAILKSPMFPVKADALLAQMEYKEIICGEKTETDMGIVDAIRLHHPNVCTGYTFHIGGKKICSLIDCENTNEEIIRFAEGADLLIMDAQYTKEEYAVKQGWGHSTCESCCRFAEASGAGKLVLMHHDPFHTDSMLDLMQHTVRDYPGTVFAYDGMKLLL